MEREAQQERQALFKAFCKGVDTANKNGEKIKFSLQSFRLIYRSSTGFRGEQEGEMMWEQEWYEEARKASVATSPVRKPRENGSHGSPTPNIPETRAGPEVA